MSSKVSTASRGRNAHFPLQLAPPHVVVAGNRERDVRLVERILTNAGYAVTVVAAGRPSLAQLQRRTEAVLRRHPADLLVVANQDPLESTLELVATLREQSPGLATIAITPSDFDDARPDARGMPDALIRAPIDAAELRKAARQLVPALPELIANASA
jgi:CheY-like chemotaxis protein